MYIWKEIVDYGYEPSRWIQNHECCQERDPAFANYYAGHMYFGHRYTSAVFTIIIASSAIFVLHVPFAS